MIIDPVLKPLFANIKRLNMGDFFYSKEFKLFTIENNIDDVWNDCKKEVSKKKTVFMAGYHNTEEEEEAFGYLMSLWYNQDNDSFSDFITNVFLNFAKWHSIKLNYTAIYHNLEKLDIKENNLLLFTIESNKIRESKPEKIEESVLDIKNTKEFELDKTKVFIVHGHDDLAKSETARFIEKLGFEPVILHEQPSAGATIIEKIEENSNVGFGIVLYTACDVGAKKGEETNLKDRARQNVIFEHGYLMGKINRKNVCALVKGKIETPNDISGVVYISMTADWKLQLAKELRKSGYNVNMNLA
jgi:predicted nucleotide-binding protein